MFKVKVFLDNKELTNEDSGKLFIVNSKVEKTLNNSLERATNFEQKKSGKKSA